MGAQWVSARTFRFGASGLLDALIATIGGAPAESPATSNPATSNPADGQEY